MRTQSTFYLMAIVLLLDLFPHLIFKVHSYEGSMNSNHVMMTKRELKWVNAPPSLPAGARMAVVHGDPKKPGLFAMRLILPNDYQVPAHWHPADEHVTVISGTFNMGMGDKLDKSKTKPLPAGSFAMMRRGTPHFAWARGKTVVQVHAMGPWGIHYVNPKDDPRRKKR